ncbi:MAG: hypothetical protein ACRCZB_05585 [Bacteroidales bacterium]
MIDLNEIAKKANANRSVHSYANEIFVWSKCLHDDVEKVVCLSKKGANKKQHKRIKRLIIFELFFILENILAFIDKEDFDIEQCLDKFVSSNDIHEKCVSLFEE